MRAAVDVHDRDPGLSGKAQIGEALGYFDQAHLPHALRRYVGRTARELREGGDHAAMSFRTRLTLGPGASVCLPVSPGRLSTTQIPGENPNLAAYWPRETVGHR